MCETKHQHLTVAEASSALFKKHTPTLAKGVEFIFIYIYMKHKIKMKVQTGAVPSVGSYF